MKFTAIVRDQPSPFGVFGKITSKHLGAYVGKLVLVRIEIVTQDTKLPPTKSRTPLQPQTKSGGTGQFAPLSATPALSRSTSNK